MHLTLHRTYAPNGSNGAILIDGVRICHTIELPWRNNEPGRSCIPEGEYRLRYRWSRRHEGHLLVEDVPHRSLILIHAANNAANELRGCIAPVTCLTGPGQGIYSRLALKGLLQLVYDLAENDPLYLVIRSQLTEPQTATLEQ